ncbi:MAG: phage tail tape measure protein [Bacteroidaceae bacterium]|nr:phage tail tape measure protein [Bacteroidaceae bacterium]
MATNVSYGKIQLQADVKNANAGMKALQDRAEQLRSKITSLKDELSGTADTGRIKDINKEIRQTERQLGQVNKMLKDNVRGMSAFEEILKNGINSGSIAQLASAITYATQRLKNLGAGETELRDSFRSFTEESRAQMNILSKGYEHIMENLGNVRKVSDTALDGFIADMERVVREGNILDEYMAKYRANLEAARQQRTSRQLANVDSVIGSDRRMNRHSEDEIQAAIQLAKELRSHLKPTEDAYKTLTAQILAAEEHIKQYSLAEARAAEQRAAIMERMKAQLSSVTTISDSALAESRKYWQAQLDGVKKGSTAYKEYTANLQRVTAEEERRARKADELRAKEEKAAAGRVMRHLGTSSVTDIENAIRVTERLRDAQARNSAEWEKFNSQIIKARDYLRSFDEAAKASSMEERMRNLSTLTATSLQEVKRYYQAQSDGSQRYLQILASIEAEERKRADSAERMKLAQQEANAQRVMGNLAGSSLSEIESSIKVYEQLAKQVTYGGQEWRGYTAAVKNAQDYIERFAVDPQWEKMKQQLSLGGLSSGALKSQEQYWARMRDQAGLTAEKAAEAQRNLETVRNTIHANLQQSATSILNEVRGPAELGEYANKTGAEWKEAIKVLEQYKETLRMTDDAEEINKVVVALDTLKGKTDEAKASMMSQEEASKRANQVMSGTYDGTIEDLEKAKKALEAFKKTLNVTSQNAELQKTERQISAIEVELKTVNMTAAEFQQILADPSKVDDLEKLKAALKRADAQMQALAHAGKKNSDEFETLSKQSRILRDRLSEVENAGKKIKSAFSKAVDRLKTYVGVYMGFQAVWTRIMGTFRDALELSDKMGEVGKTTNLSAVEVDNLQRRFAAIDTRTAQEELANLAAAAGQLGLKSTEDIYGFVEAANKITVALPEMGRQGITQLMKIAQVSGDIERNGGDIQESLERVGSTIDKLRASSASAAPQITDFVARIGGVAASSNMTMSDMAALGSTVDALGMRIEMTATALSRMIPAIRDNSYGVAKAINVPEKALKDLFAQGKGMQAMVLIFQKLRESAASLNEEDAAESVEAILGRNAALKEVMSELNQQGARAGIVFSALSKNVDELERQLAIARDAYSQNTAIQQEYDRMNQTAAARLERLKHQIEEAFVNPAVLNFLEWLFGKIQKIVTAWQNHAAWVNATLILVVGLARGWNQTLRDMYVATEKWMGGVRDKFVAAYRLMRFNAIKELRAVAAANAQAAASLTLWNKGVILVRAGFIALRSILMTIVPMLAIAGAVFIVTKLYQWVNGIKAVDKAAGDLNSTLQEERSKVDGLFDSQTKQSEVLAKVRDEAEELRNQAESLRKEIESGTDATNQSTLSEEQKRVKEEELREVEEKLKVKEEELGKERDRNRAIIEEINSKYSSYLGYMLTEVTRAENIAAAHQLINAALREELLLKEKNGIQDKVREGLKEKRDKANAAAQDELSGLSSEDRAKVNEIWNGIMSQISGYDAKTNRWNTSLKVANGQSIEDAIFNAFYDGLKKIGKGDYARDWWGGSILGIRDMGFRDVMQVSLEELKTASEQERNIDAELSVARSRTTEAAIGEFKELETSIKSIKLEGLSEKDLNKNIRELAENLRGMSSQLGKYSGLQGKTSAKGAAGTDVKSLADFYLGGLSSENRKKLDIQLAALAPVSDGGGGGGSSNRPTSPYGTYDRNKTEYSEWDADTLVARRKEMLERVRSLANGAEVGAVLSEDKALMEAYAKGLIKNERDAWEWYNTERLKIEKELDSRNLTTTGNWKDPGNEAAALERARKKQQREENREARDVMTAGIAAIKAYYTERANAIKEGREKNEITEGEMNRQLELNSIEQETRLNQYRAMLLDQRLAIQAGYQAKEMEIRSIYANDSEAMNAALLRNEQEMNRALEGVVAKNRDTGVKVTAEASRQVLEIINTQNDTIEDLSGKLVKTSYTLGANFGKALADGIRLQIAKGDSNIQSILVKHQARIKKALESDNANVEKTAVEFGETLDKLDLVFDLNEEADTSPELLKRRLNLLIRYAQDAHRMTAEQLRAMMAEEVEFSGWEKDRTSEDYEVLLQRLQHFLDDRMEAIKKDAERRKKLNDFSWKNSDAGQALAGTIETTGSVAEQVKSARTAGKASDQDVRRAEVKAIEAQILAKQTYIEVTRAQMAVELARMEQERAFAAEDEQRALDERNRYQEGTEEWVQANEVYEDVRALHIQRENEYTAAKQTNDAALLASEQEMVELQNSLREKQDEIMAAKIEKFQGYASAIEDFAYSMGEAAWSEVDDRKAAAKALLKTTMQLTKDIIMDEMKRLIMKRTIKQSETAMEQAQTTAETAIHAQQVTTDLNLTGVKVGADVAAGTASGGAKTIGQLGWWGIPLLAVIGAALSALMGLAMAKINKAKDEVQSIVPSAGKMATGMLTYATGNVEQVTGGAAQKGQTYSVDGADGKTYRARYEGAGMKTGVYRGGAHFGIFSEKQPELIVDGRTTQKLMLNYPAIIDAIQTLSRGGSLPAAGSRGGGMRTFASGNVDDVLDGVLAGEGEGGGDLQMQTELANLREVVGQLSQTLAAGIKATTNINILGPDGLDEKMQKATRYKQRNGLS